MANKVGAPKNLGTHRDNKLREQASRIAGKARRTLFTQFDLEVNSPVTNQILFTETFSSKLFQSPGDAIAITAVGRINVNAELINELQIYLLDGDGLALTTLILGTVHSAPASTVYFEGRGLCYINRDNLFGYSSSYMFTGSSSGNFNFSNQPNIANSTGKFSVVADYSGDELELDFVQAEFIPAVIT